MDKALDKFTQLYQEDKVKEILERAAQQPTADMPEQPPSGAAEAKPQQTEGGGLGDTLQKGIKNISEFGPIPPLQAVKEKLSKGSEPDLSFGKKTGMEKLKALPGEIYKSGKTALNAMIPGTVGEAGLMYAGGKILKGIFGFGRGIKEGYKTGLAGQELADVKAAGALAKEELPKISEVKENIAIRSAGASEVAPEQFGTGSRVSPYLSEKALNLANEEAPGLVERAKFRLNKKELTSHDLIEQGKIDAQGQAEAEAEIAAGLHDIDKIKKQLELDTIHRMEDMAAAEEGAAPILPGDRPQEEVLAKLVEEARKEHGSRIVTPNDVSRALGRELLPSEEAALSAKVPTELTAYVFGFAEKAKVSEEQTMAHIAQFRGGALESEDQIKYFFQNFIALAAKTKNALEEGARATQAGGQEDVKAVTKIAEMLKKQQELQQALAPDIPLTGTQIARMIDTLGFSRAAQVAEEGERLGWNMLTSHIYFSELSNPRTWQVNTGVSTFLMPLYQSASIALGSRLQPKVLSETSKQAAELARYFPGAAEAHLYGALDGFMTAVRHVTESWKGGGLRGLFTDLRNLNPLPYSFAESLPPTPKPSISAENVNKWLGDHEKLSWMQFDPDGIMKPLARFLDAYGEGAHFTRQIMEAGDRLAYLTNEHAHRASQAFSRAVEDGLEGDKLVKFVKEQISRPVALVQEAAERNAMHDIFREPITGGMGSLVRGLGHPAFRPIVTYVRTPVNIASVGLEGFPGLNRAVATIRRDFEAGGAREQLARGRWMAGSLVTAVGASMALADGFTGYGPLDPQQRQAWLKTHEPFAIKIRDTGDKERDWISLKFIQPISTWMGAAADFVQMKAWEEQPKKMTEYMWAPVVALSHAFSNTVFTQDLFNFLEAVQIKPHQSAEQWARAFEVYAENRAKNILSPFPSAAGRAVQSIFDPVTREVRGVVDAIKSSVPGWSSTLPPKLDWFGDKIEQGPAYTMLMTPVREVNTKYDKVSNEIARQQPSLLTLPNFLDGMEISSKDLHDFKHMRGKEVKLFNGKNMGDALLALVNSEQYEKGTDGPHGSKAKLLSAYVTAYTKKATAELAKKDPRFYNLLGEFENAEALTGHPIKRPGFLRIQPE